MQLGISEMIFIFLLALLIFGPRKLPEIGRQIGKFMAEFKRASNEFKSQIEDEIRQIDLQEQEKQIAPPAAAPEKTVASAPPNALAAAAEAPAEPAPPPSATGVQGG
jgi:sec-independent protein translocase protein TatB